jgi:hypothetical protein
MDEDVPFRRTVTNKEFSLTTARAPSLKLQK